MMKICTRRGVPRITQVYKRPTSFSGQTVERFIMAMATPSTSPSRRPPRVTWTVTTAPFAKKGKNLIAN